MDVLAKIRSRVAAAKSTRQLRQLTAKEKTREKRLRRLLDRLNAGKDVARRELETALTADEWSEYESFIEQERAVKEASQRPKQFDKYLKMLKKADFAHNKSLVTPTTKRTVRDYRGRTGAVRLQHQAESGYEALLIHLEELLTTANTVERFELLSWLDREVDFSAGSHLGADAELVPRLKSSKSMRSQSTFSRDNIFVMRRANKAMILEQALDTLIYEEAAASEVSKRSEILKALHNITDDDGL